MSDTATPLPEPGLDTVAFHAPIPHSRIETLFGEYRRTRERIEALHAVIRGELGGAVAWFLSGARQEVRGERVLYRHVPDPGALFDLDQAPGALNAAYCRKVMDLTDVYQCMPQARRDEWDRSIDRHSTPHFERETVEATLRQWLPTRGRYFAEKVDGVFRRLSGEHVTNQPQGFGKRFIPSYVFNRDSTIPDYSAAGYIHDLREVIAKFMGREPPGPGPTGHVLHVARSDTGRWVRVDGGSWKLRAYRKGTVPIEVHPDMAWRLNGVLHQLHPRAIPPAFRRKPQRQARTSDVFDRPLPFPVLQVLEEGRCEGKSFRFGYGSATELSTARAEAVRVLEGIGGVVVDRREVEFDYPPKPVIDRLIGDGVLPDKVAHQYYPTPESVAEHLIECAAIEGTHSVLEPSAGQGAIAARIVAEYLECVEIGPLHCRILEQRCKGAKIHRADFLAWDTSRRFDRIVMNPPYSEGRATVHVERAARLLKPGGRLVALLPGGLRNGSGPSHGRKLPAGRWGRVFENAFAGTSIAVAVYIVDRAG